MTIKGEGYRPPIFSVDGKRKPSILYKQVYNNVTDMKFMKSNWQKQDLNGKCHDTWEKRFSFSGCHPEKSLVKTFQLKALHPVRTLHLAKTLHLENTV